MARGADALLSMEQYQRAYDTAARGVAASPAGSDERITWIRKATEAGYFLAWGRLDQKDEASAAVILNQLTQWLAPFDRPNVTPRMRLPLARLLWTQSRIASEKGDKAEDARLKARVLALTADRKALAEDYGPISKLHITALWYNRDRERDAAAACRIVGELEALVPGSMALKLMECDIEAARSHMTAKRLDAARASLDRARNRFTAAQGSAQGLDLKMAMVEAENVAALVAREAQDFAGEARTQIATARLLAQALKGTTFFQNSTTQISTMYDGFKYLDPKVLPEYDSEEKRQRLIADVFGGVAESVEASRLVFRKSPYFAVVAADANGKAASAHNKMGVFEQGLSFAQRAVTAVEEAGLLADTGEFTENAEVVCSAHGRKVESLVGLRRTDDALAAHTALTDRCGRWLRQYPWDFYARYYLPQAASKLGPLLADEGRFAEALPLLQYASNWGLKEASSRLATLYREGRGVPVDLERAAALDKLASGQGMKRFTVPTDFDGVKHPFHMYVIQFGGDKRCPADRPLRPEEEDCAGFYGVDDQVQWVKVARGGTVPQDVITSFRKLDDIARENKVSFPDLAAYALGAAQDEKKNEARAAATQSAAAPPAGVGIQPQATDSFFYSLEMREGKPVLTATSRISRGSPANCFGWAIRVPPEDRTIELREDYFLPAAPSEPHNVSSASTVMDGGRKIATRLSLSAKSGWLSHDWCASPGDPLGAYRLEVHRDGALHRQFEFEMVE